jgi:hypothetical protein
MKNIERRSEEKESRSKINNRHSSIVNQPHSKRSTDGRRAVLAGGA